MVKLEVVCKENDIVVPDFSSLLDFQKAHQIEYYRTPKPSKNQIRTVNKWINYVNNHPETKEKIRIIPNILQDLVEFMEKYKKFGDYVRVLKGLIIVSSKKLPKEIAKTYNLDESFYKKGLIKRGIINEIEEFFGSEGNVALLSGSEYLLEEAKDHGIKPYKKMPSSDFEFELI